MPVLIVCHLLHAWPGHAACIPMSLSSACSNVQQYDASNDTIQNGIYLGHVASFTFRGPFNMNKVGDAQPAQILSVTSQSHDM